MTKAEKEHYAKLARLGCVLCAHISGEWETPSEIHHIRKVGQKRSNAEVIPLCPSHHRLGNASIHFLGRKGFSKHWGFDEDFLLEKINRKLNAYN